MIQTELQKPTRRLLFRFFAKAAVRPLGLATTAICIAIMSIEPPALRPGTAIALGASLNAQARTLRRKEVTRTNQRQSAEQPQSTDKIFGDDLTSSSAWTRYESRELDYDNPAARGTLKSVRESFIRSGKLVEFLDMKRIARQLTSFAPSGTRFILVCSVWRVTCQSLNLNWIWGAYLHTSSEILWMTYISEVEEDRFYGAPLQSIEGTSKVKYQGKNAFEIQFSDPRDNVYISRNLLTQPVLYWHNWKLLASL